MTEEVMTDDSGKLKNARSAMSVRKPHAFPLLQMQFLLIPKWKFKQRNEWLTIDTLEYLLLLPTLGRFCANYFTIDSVILYNSIVQYHPVRYLLTLIFEKYSLYLPTYLLIIEYMLVWCCTKMYIDKFVHQVESTKYPCSKPKIKNCTIHLPSSIHQTTYQLFV